MGRLLFLTGFSGCGKSSVARILQNRFGANVYDLDAEVESLAGSAIENLVRVEGEPRFRKLETEALARICKHQSGVVSLGGGAVAFEENRKLISKRGELLFLSATVGSLVSRLTSSADLAELQKRPLLSGYCNSIEQLKERISELLAERLEAYQSAMLTVVTDYSPSELIAESVNLIQVSKQTSGIVFPIQFSEDTSSIISVGSGLLENLAKVIKTACPKSKRVALLIDENVKTHFGDKLLTVLTEQGYIVTDVAIEPGEKSKNLNQVLNICETLAVQGFTRSDVALCVGGGVVGDVGGLVASLFMRGIELVQLPTTIVSQADSALGGKTGVNLKTGKNLVGTFYPARIVLADVEVLKTLPEREYVSGLAEVIKCGFIYRESLLDFLEQNAKAVLARETHALQQIISDSIETKLAHVSGDLRDTTGLRATLNYGHTLGHAIERLSNYGDLLHGEAVAIGMQFAVFVGEQLGLVEENFSKRMNKLLEEYGLSLSIPASLIEGASRYVEELGLPLGEPFSEITKSDEAKRTRDSFYQRWNDAFRADKKRESDSVRFVIVRRAGDVEHRMLPVPRLVDCLALFASSKERKD